MAKLLTDCKSPEEAIKVMNDRVLEAMKPPPIMDVSKFSEFIDQKGGKAPQPFGKERLPAQRLSLGQ